MCSTTPEGRFPHLSFSCSRPGNVASIVNALAPECRYFDPFLAISTTHSPASQPQHYIKSCFKLAEASAAAAEMQGTSTMA
jgi:hypothetical protein